MVGKRSCFSSVSIPFYFLEAPDTNESHIRAALFFVPLLSDRPYERITQKTEIVTLGSRAKTRVPDLMVLSELCLMALEASGKSVIMLDMPPPILVVEVVSPGKENRDRDYRFKRSEYAARGITYYWIVDPQEKKFTCLELVDGFYEEKAYPKSDQEISITQPFELKLNLENIFDEA